MARYRNIHCMIWNDDKFPFMSDQGKLVFFHLLTTTFSTPFGCYKAGKAALTEESRMDQKGYDKGFQECLSKGLAKYDETFHVVFIKNFPKHNPPSNPNVIKSWYKIFDELPNSHLKHDCYTAISDACEAISKAFGKAFIEAFGKGMAKQEQEQEQEQEQDKEICANIDPAIEASKDGNGNGKGKPQKAGGGCFIDSSGIKYYPTKKGRKLTGWKLEAFDRFWDAFDKKTGRAAAADAWLDIKGLDDNLVEEIITAAEKEAKARPAKEERGMTAKFPQGWLSDRRWEDQDMGFECQQKRRNNNGDTRTTEQIREDRLRVLSGTN